MSASAALQPVPRCTSCTAALLTTDGADDRRRCPRCGRAYVARLLHAGDRSAYRDAPIFELDLVREPPPRVRGLQVRRNDEVLDVRLGAPGFLSIEVVIACLGALGGGLFLALLFHMISLAGALPILVVGLGLVASTYARFQRVTETLTVSAGAVVWSRRPISGDPITVRSHRLSDVVSAHASSDRVRLELVDGGPLEIGAGMELSPAALRWIAERLAEHAGPR